MSAALKVATPQGDSGTVNRVRIYSGSENIQGFGALGLVNTRMEWQILQAALLYNKVLSS